MEQWQGQSSGAAFFAQKDNKLAQKDNLLLQKDNLLLQKVK